MRIEIGARDLTKGAPDVVDLLLECHARMRTFAALARKVALEKEGPPAEVQDAAARIARYFSEALPLHVQDEERTLLPRLKGLDKELDIALSHMAAEHHAHETNLGRLVEICRDVAADPARLATHRGELRYVSGAVEAGLAAHMRDEEAIVFPAVRARLSEEARAVCLAELRGRRGARVT